MFLQLCRFSLIGLLALGLIGPVPRAQAQLAEAAVGAALAGAAGLAIVDRLEAKFQSVNAQAQATANIATGNALVAIASVISGLRQAFAEERQVAFEGLSNERKALIVDLYNLLNQLEKGVALQRGYLKADAIDLMNGVLILTTKVRFMITSIDPVVFAWQESGDYDLQIIGVGVGLPSSAENYRVRVEVDGNELGPEALSPFPNMLNVKLSAAKLKTRFDMKKFTSIPVKITSTHIVQCGFLWLNSCEVPYALSFAVKLYPRVAGTVIVQQTRPRNILVNQQVLLTNEIATGDHHNKPEGVYGSGPIVPPTGWRVTRAWYDPSRCHPASPDGENACAFFSGGSCTVQGVAANCTIAQGSHPKIFQFTYEIAEEKTVPEELPVGEPIAFAPGQTQPIRFDRNATYVSLNAELADGRSGRFVLKPDNGSPTPYLTCGQTAHLASDVSQIDCWINLLN